MEEYGEMKFSDYQFSVGVHARYRNEGEWRTLVLPEELGRFVTRIKYLDGSADQVYPAVSCSDAFTLDTTPNF